MKKILLCVLLILCCSGFVFGGQFEDTLKKVTESGPTTAPDYLQEANQKFTYQAKPIDPGLVHEFSSWISDPGMPTTISVDVSAEHSNEYSDSDVSINEAGTVCKQGEGEFFCYSWIGRLTNGLHVLNVYENGGGSGTFCDLFFVKFDVGQGYTSKGKLYDRLLMSIVRTYGLGDRFSGDIKLDGNRVLIKGKHKEGSRNEVVEFGDLATDLSRDIP